MTQTHSKMLTTRRRKKRGKKDLARAAKIAKKLARHEPDAVPDTKKKSPA